ncbi:MAG: hypothetical protein AB1481_04660 [Candidatus Omnitrophota bacterium]
MEKNRRRNYFIKRKFQVNFILKFCTLIVIGSFLSTVIIYLLTGKTLTTVFENSRLVIKSTADFILPATLLSSALVVIIIGAFTILITLFSSHRIAGPLYRMEKDIQELSSGNLKIKFSLRDSDELKALAENLQKLAAFFHANISTLKNAFFELEGLIDEIAKCSSPQDFERIKFSAKKLKSGLEKFSV